MNFFAISALINFITSSVLGIFVISRGRNNKNIGFFAFCFCVASWSLSYFFWQISKSSADALFWCRTLMAAAIFIPVTYLHFVYALVEILDRRKKFLIFSYFLFLLFLAADFTPYFVSHIEPILNFKFWPMAGPIYSIFLLVWFFYVIYSTYLLYKKYKISNGVVRLQIRYVILGMVIGFAGGATNYFLWYKILIPPVANILVSVYVGSIAYAIARYRLMDIRIVFRNTLVYVGAATFVYGVFYFTTWINNVFFGGVYTNGAYLIGVPIAFGFIFLFQVFNKFIIKIANKYLFFSLYSYQETINKLSEELTYYNDLNKIVDTIVDTIKKTMGLNRAGVLLVNLRVKPIHFQIFKVVGFNKENGISLVQDNFLTKYLEKTQKPLVADELDLLAQDARVKANKDGFLKMRDYMNHIEASLCLPLISGKKLIGIIVLGSKTSGDAYSKEDLELLNILSRQAAIAIDNARLYKESREFGKTLQGKVNEQTKDIIQKNQYLQELLTMKTDFLRVVNHQLNTPLSVLRNSFSMVEEGIFPPKKGFEYAKAGLERMSETIQDFWDAFELEGEKMKMHINKVNIEEIVNRLIEEKKKLQLAQERNIAVSVVKPTFPIPPVWCDGKKTTHVISNLLDNAVFYTQKGSVTLNYELLDNKLKINIKDTGVGITEENKKRLFIKFSRGSGSTNLHPDGSGLGLYIAKKIMEASDGEITYFSDGDGKGSIFSFTIPVYADQQSVQETSPERGRAVTMLEKNNTKSYAKN